MLCGCSVVVQEEFGTPEREPDATAMLRRFLMEDEPELFDLISNGDPQIRMCVDSRLLRSKDVHRAFSRMMDGSWQRDRCTGLGTCRILEDPTWATKAAKTMATVTAMESAAT